MTIRIKVANTARELKDAYQLRHQVYAEEEHAFSANSLQLIADHFDAMPNSACVIAYENDIAVGTIRVNLDSDILLPADKDFDFSYYRRRIIDQAKAEHRPPPLLVSAGMLAISKDWRNRRDVFRALFKLGCDVAYSWGATHIISTVSEKSATIYRRLGFETLAEKVWYESANEYVVPVASDLNRVYKWAFNALADKQELLKSFAGCFEYLLISANHYLFKEGDPGDKAYVISHGAIEISRTDPISGRNLSLATLKSGELLGELSLIDDEPRSANAIAAKNTELVVLDAQVFWEKVHEDSDYLHSLLVVLSRRIRAIDHRAFIYAHGSAQQRLEYFLADVKNHALLSTKEANKRMATITVTAFAYMASTTIPETEAFLFGLEAQGRLKITDKLITFYG